jgi:glyoxylate reductase
MRILLTRPIYEESVRRLIEAGLDVTRREDLPAGLGLAEAARGAEVLISHLTDRIDGDMLRANPQLRLVANVAAGYDNVDVAAAADAGVIVTNTPGVLTNATADMALALILAVARRVPESDMRVRSEGRVDWSLKQEPMGVAVSGRTLGIIGMGRIGAAVAKRAQDGFGMRVIFSGGSGAAALEAVERGAVAVPLATLLAEADFVSLHAPLSSKTRHLINGEALAAMKQSAVLINTSRGQLVDEGALAYAITNGVILGAGLDVFEREPDVHPDLLALRERVVLTSHIGSATEETRRAMSDIAVDNVLAFAAGGTVRNPVGTSELRPALSGRG